MPGLCISTSCLSLSELRQREMESCTLTRRALSPDAPTMLLHNAAANREAKSRSAHHPRIRSIDLLKAFKNRFQLVTRNAAASIHDADTHFVRTVRARDQPDLGTRRRELDRVAEKVRQRLQNAIGVDMHRNGLRINAKLYSIFLHAG